MSKLRNSSVPSSLPTSLEPRGDLRLRLPAADAVVALTALMGTLFPMDRFPDIHQASRRGKRESFASHHQFASTKAAGGRMIQGENIATMRRVVRLTELITTFPDVPLDDLIEQAWRDEPLAQETGHAPEDARVRPVESGIYVVRHMSRDSLPVDISRRAQERGVASVTTANVKFGVSVDLRRRQRDYERTFVEAEVRFQVIARLPREDLAAVEAQVRRRVSEHRLRSPSGYPLEWLEGIDEADLVAIIGEVVREHLDSKE